LDLGSDLGLWGVKVYFADHVLLYGRYYMHICVYSMLLSAEPYAIAGVSAF